MRGLSLVVASRGHSSSRCAGLSLSWPLFLWSTGSRRAGLVVVAHGPSYSAACGIFFPDQGSNPCPLHWQADSQPLRHQGSPAPLLDPPHPETQLWAVPCHCNLVTSHTNPLLCDCRPALGCELLKGGTFPIGLCHPGILCSTWEIFAE